MNGVQIVKKPDGSYVVSFEIALTDTEIVEINVEEKGSDSYQVLTFSKGPEKRLFQQRFATVAEIKLARALIEAHKELHAVEQRADEPVFVLLGRDPQAPALIKKWALDRFKAEPTSSKVGTAFQVAARMEKFKERFPELGLSSDLYRKAILTPFHNETYIRQQAEQLVSLAEESGVVLSIMTKSKLPLASGNIEMVVDTRPARGHY